MPTPTESENKPTKVEDSKTNDVSTPDKAVEPESTVEPVKSAEKPAIEVTPTNGGTEKTSNQEDETPVNEEAPGDSAKDQEPSTDVTSNGEEVKETPTEEVNVPVKEVETPEKTEEVETPTTENNSNGEGVKETPTKEEVAETPSEDEDSSKETPSENKPDTEVKPGSVVKPTSEKPQSDDTKVPAKPEATGTKNVTKADIKAGLNQVVTKAETAKVLDRRGSKNYQTPNILPATGEASAASLVLAGALVASFGFVGLKKRKN